MTDEIGVIVDPEYLKRISIWVVPDKELGFTCHLGNFGLDVMIVGETKEIVLKAARLVLRRQADPNVREDYVVRRSHRP